MLAYPLTASGVLSQAPKQNSQCQWETRDTADPASNGIGSLAEGKVVTLGKSQRNVTFRKGENYRPIIWITPLKVQPRSVILFQLAFSLQEEGLCFRLRSWRVNAGAEP